MLKYELKAGTETAGFGHEGDLSEAVLPVPLLVPLPACSIPPRLPAASLQRGSRPLPLCQRGAEAGCWAAGLAEEPRCRTGWCNTGIPAVVCVISLTSDPQSCFLQGLLCFVLQYMFRFMSVRTITLAFIICLGKMLLLRHLGSGPAGPFCCSPAAGSCLVRAPRGRCFPRACKINAEASRVFMLELGLMQSSQR